MSKKAKTKPAFVLRVRAYESGFCSVWVIRRDGAADGCLLHGELIPPAVQELVVAAEAAGWVVEREQSPWENVRPTPVPGAMPVAEQATLF